MHSCTQLTDPAGHAGPAWHAFEMTEVQYITLHGCESSKLHASRQLTDDNETRDCFSTHLAGPAEPV